MDLTLNKSLHQIIEQRAAKRRRHKNTYERAEVIKSRRRQRLRLSYKHKAFQKVKHKLDLIQKPYLDVIHSRSRGSVTLFGNFIRS